MVKVGEIYIDDDLDIYQITKLYSARDKEVMDILPLYLGGNGFDPYDDYNSYTGVLVTVIEKNNGAILNNKLIEILYGIEQ